jgi:KDO2-lipid IV(A) lauroyltransferase
MAKERKERNDLADRLQYVALRVVAMMLLCWPVGWVLGAAEFLGDFMYAVDVKHRKRALANLAFCFPELSLKERKRIARESMRQLFLLFVEVLFTTRLVRIDTWAKVAELDNFRETLVLLMEKHRGLIMLTGHYGNWEILGYIMATLGFETTSVARPLDNPYVNDWLLGVRERRGQRIIAKTGATDLIPDILKAGGAVGFIADQNAGKKGIFVDFFGRKASTYKSIGLLAMEYDVPVVIGYARRKGSNFTFKVGTQDIIYPEDWKGQERPLEYITQRYTAGVEAFVREDPSQYLWVHRRWKSRPRGEEAMEYD